VSYCRWDEHNGKYEKTLKKCSCGSTAKAQNWTLKTNPTGIGFESSLLDSAVNYPSKGYWKTPRSIFLNYKRMAVEYGIGFLLAGRCPGHKQYIRQSHVGFGLGMDKDISSWGSGFEKCWALLLEASDCS